MRTLPLGVLIVCGGTLAALPFRRYHAIQDTSTVPTQVTGPTESALNAFPADRGHSNLDSLPSLADIDRFDGFGLSEPLGVASQPAVPRRRLVDIPLTYEDLQVPLDQPKPILDRFSATTAARQQTRDEDRVAEFVMPPMESLPLDQQHELMRVAETFGSSGGAAVGHPNQGRAGGRLASATSGNDPARSASNSVLEPLPSQSDPASQRFWIRQPQ